jgi:RNA polymerase sigma-70 factor, ECF subfamily
MVSSRENAAQFGFHVIYRSDLMAASPIIIRRVVRFPGQTVTNVSNPMEESEQRRIFDAWMSQHRGLLFKVVHAYAFSMHDRDDLFQEIVMQVWNSIPRFRAESRVTTRLYRVALNSSLAWTRAERKHWGRTEALNGTEPSPAEPKHEGNPRLDWLHEEIAQMDHVDRSLTLLLLDGFSYRDVAETLGISENNIGVKLNRIKTRLINKSKETDQHGP